MTGAELAAWFCDGAALDMARRAQEAADAWERVQLKEAA